MEHSNYVNFKNEVYKELDTLKAKLNRKQLIALEGFDSTTVMKTLYGCLYANTASSHAKKLYPKNFQDALLDLNDKNTFNAGQNHTALEKLLFNRNDLCKEVHQYVSGEKKETVGIDSYIRDLENQMIEMNKPKPIEEVEFVLTEEKQSSPIGDVIVMKVKKVPAKKKVVPTTHKIDKEIEKLGVPTLEQEFKNLSKRVDSTTRKIDKEFEKLGVLDTSGSTNVCDEIELTEDTTKKPKIEKEFIFDLSLPVKKDNGLIIEKTKEFIL